jgi:hypothetical protein
MPTILLDLRRIDYVSDQNVVVSAWRAYAEALFVTPAGVLVPFSCIVDPGAPFSVLPFSLWHDRNLKWTSLGQQLTRQGGLVPEPLEWQGAACTLGETAVHLLDLQTRVQAGPFLVVAKLPRQRLPQPSLETIALLGLNFLTDNFLRLVLDGTGGSLVGSLTVP